MPSELPIEKIIEALLFASDQPLSLHRIKSILKNEPEPESTGVTPAKAGVQTNKEKQEDEEPPLVDEDQESAEAMLVEPDDHEPENTIVEELVVARDEFDAEILVAIESLKIKYAQPGSPAVILELAGGWQFATNPLYAPWIKKLFKDRTAFRLSQAALETLAIIGYRQPITRAEIEQIRGVEVIAALETLLERNLIKVGGRKETIGRPLLYETTMEFLRQFGLASLGDLPELAEGEGASLAGAVNEPLPSLVPPPSQPAPGGGSEN